MPTRPRLPIALAIALFVALCVFVPGFLYVTELALRELRVGWWLIVVLAALIWLLTRHKPGQ